MTDFHWSLLLLLLALAAVWLPPVALIPGRDRLPLWPLPYAAVCGLVSARGLVAPLAIIALVLLPALAWAQTRTGSLSLRSRKAVEWTTIALCFTLAIRLWPGFPETLLVLGAPLSADAPPFRLTAALDAGVAGLFMLALYAPRLSSWPALRSGFLPTCVIAIVTTAVVLTVAVASGYLRWDPKLPPHAALYLVKTWFWTCLVEECFFRGIVQERLMRRGLHLSAILLAAVLFALAHYRGGWMLVALAGLAGLGYGGAYAVTRRVEAAMAVHLAVNATHFFLFTYPRLLDPTP